MANFSQTSSIVGPSWATIQGTIASSLLSRSAELGRLTGTACAGG